MADDVKTSLQRRAKAGVGATKTLADYLGDPKVKQSLQLAAAKHLDADRLARVALSVSRQPQLASCTPLSILNCVMQSAQLGLEPVLGRCYYVPYRVKGTQEAQFILGYQGLIELARRSGQLKMIYAEVVRRNDQFSYELGLHPDLKHVPAPGERGEMVGVYSVAHYKDGGYNFTYLTKHDIDRTRARSASAKSGRSPWDTDEEAMWKKTAIRALRSVLPLQVEQTLQVEAEPGDMKPVDFDEAPTNFDTETGEVFDAEIVEEEEPLPPEEMDDGQQ